MRRTEVELILSCSRTRLDNRLTDHVLSLLKEEIDWDDVIRIAVAHRVMPLLFINLQKTHSRSIPQTTLKKLKTYYYTNLQHSLTIAGELVELIALFQEKNISFIPFKGPALAESVYGDSALRQFADLDILVGKKDISTMYQLLLSLDYRPEIDLTAAQLIAYAKTEYSLSLYNMDTKVTVELHWNLTGRYTTYPMVMDHFDGHFESTTFSGAPIRQMPVEDLLMYLCIHGSKDCWCNLDSICCVAELVGARSDIDWGRVMELADQIRCRRMLDVGLLLAHHLLAAPIPSRVLEVIETDPIAMKITTKVTETLFIQKNKRINSNFSLFHFNIRESLCDRARYLLYLLFVPSRRDWGIFPLPTNLTFLYYPLRPLRLAGEIALSLFK